MVLTSEAAPARAAAPPRAVEYVLMAAGVLVCLGYATEQTLVAAAGVGLALVVLAGARFEVFLLVVLGLRAALDATKGAGGIEPTTVLGALFLLAVATREVLIRASGAGRPMLRAPFRIPLFLLLAVSVVAGIVSDAPGRSLTETLRLAGVVAMLVALERTLASEAAVPRVLTAVFLSSLIPLAVGMRQVLRGDGRIIGDFSRVMGTFTHPNPYSIYLAMIIVLGVALMPHVAGMARGALAIVLVVSGVVLIFTYTRGSWIATVVGLVVVGLLQSRMLVAGIVVLLVAVVVLVPGVRERFSDVGSDEQSKSGAPTNSLTWRLQHWKDALDLSGQSPLIGIGLKGIERSTLDEKNAHNDLVRMFVETGIVGLGAYLALAWSLVVTAGRGVRRAPPGWRRGLAVGFAGIVAVLAVVSLSSNVITQVVLLWYVVAIGMAVVAVSAAPAGSPRRASPRAGRP